MKKYVISALLCSAFTASQAIDVNKLRITAPIRIPAPLLTDTVDANGKRLEATDLIYKVPLADDLWQAAEATTDSVLASCEANALRMAGFTLENTGFAKVTFDVKCKSRHTLYVDGKEQNGEAQLVPGRHDVALKLMQKDGEADTLRISLSSAQEKYLTINPEGKRYWTLSDLMNGDHLSSASLSSTGRYMMQNRYITRTDASTEWSKEFVEVATGNRLSLQGFSQWASTGDRYIRTRRDAKGGTVYESVDVRTGQAVRLGRYKGSGHASLVAGETKLLISEQADGPAETNNDVHQILEPDDRQAGWRRRSNCSLMDLQTGIITPLTAGHDNAYASVSDDGNHLLLHIHKHDITRRPFSFTTILHMDLVTGRVDTLIHDDGFIQDVQFSPDARQISIVGSGECLGGIGNVLPEGRIPSTYDYELYLMDLDTHATRCLTRQFVPSVTEVKWCKADGCMYLKVEEGDLVALYRANPKTDRIEKLKTEEPYVKSYDVAEDRPVLSYTGQSPTHSDRTWVMDLKSGKQSLLVDINPVRLDGIQLGECRDWSFRAERGDTIHGCYYLPPFFDATKQYPMLVYYYGGCSPVGRYLDSYYCYQEWAAMGYVVYVLQPSGCSGFGQEFASRHVNAYGDYTADDIIQGTKRFCEEHPFVNAAKVGCMGASYGGFMTMYLQTQTDIFAAAMSHAGISNPASYWGFGYWGYSYSTVSAAHSYPWNNMQLYSGHAPLFNADRVHTPILFMHGSADTNVPINESIQMFTALKILGRETAFITVEGENHHILDYRKRIRWHDSIMAWFARWLQGDATWWETMYPEKKL